MFPPLYLRLDLLVHATSDDSDLPSLLERIKSRRRRCTLPPMSRHRLAYLLKALMPCAKFVQRDSLRRQVMVASGGFLD